MLPPIPAKTTRVALSDLPETLILEGGADLDVDDVFWQHRKFVIKKITKTAGSTTVEVQAEITKRTWSRPGSFFML